MTQFMGVMTDPFTAGRGTPQAGAVGYADETLAYAAKRSASDALAAIYRKAPPMAPAFQERWNVGGGFGGSRNTDGNTVRRLRIETRSSIGGVAVGADYWFSPNTAGGLLAGWRRHQLQIGGQRRLGPLRPVSGWCVRAPHGRIGLYHSSGCLWLAGYHHRSDRDRRRRSPARAVQCQQLFPVASKAATVI